MDFGLGLRIVCERAITRPRPESIMQPFTSIVSRYVQQIIGQHQPRTARQKRRRQWRGRVRRFESLEDRSVLSATFASALSIGGPTGDRVFDMTADAAGNSYVTGCFSGTVDFDLKNEHVGDADFLTARGETDAFIAKYTPDDS